MQREEKEGLPKKYRISEVQNKQDNKLKSRVCNNVWKSQKKSNLALRAKRAALAFWVVKSSLKMPKMVHLGEFLKTWSLRSNSVTRQVSLSMYVGQKLAKKAKTMYYW